MMRIQQFPTFRTTFSGLKCHLLIRRDRVHLFVFNAAKPIWLEGPKLRTTILLAVVPVGLIAIAISLWLLPSTTPFNGWLMIETFLGFAFLVSYYLARRRQVGHEIPFIIAGLIATMLIVLTYVTVDVQRIAFVLTAIATSVMYFRVIAEFRRRKYT